MNVLHGMAGTTTELARADAAQVHARSFRDTRFMPQRVWSKGFAGVNEINPALATFHADGPVATHFSARALRTTRADDAVRFEASSAPCAVAELTSEEGLAWSMRLSAGLRFFASRRSGACALALRACGKRESQPGLFVAPFDAGPAPTEVCLPWSSFAQVAGAPRALDDAPWIERLALVGFAGPDGALDFTIHGPLEPDRILTGPALPAWYEHVVDLQYGVRALGEDRLNLFRANLFGGAATLRRLAQNLTDPARQQRAIEAVRSGRILHELAALGLGFRVLNGKIVEEADFSRGFRLFSLFRDPAQRERPLMLIELGEFGADHGELVHAAQFAAMTYDLTPPQIAQACTLLKLMASVQGLWLYWDALFDANRGPNAPRYWRDRIGPPTPALRALLGALVRASAGRENPVLYLVDGALVAG